MIDEQKLLWAVRQRRERHGNAVVTLELLESIFQEAANPSDYSHQAPAPIPQFQPEDQGYPRLKVLYSTETGQALEYKIVNTIQKEVPFMGSGKEPRTRWFTRPISELRELEGGKEAFSPLL